MKKIFTPIVASFLCLILFIQCKKETRTKLLELPAETRSGQNTLGCKINGGIYVAQGQGSCTGHSVQYYKSDSALLIKTNEGCAKGINLYCFGVHELKDYTILNPIGNSFYFYDKELNCVVYDRTNSSQTGQITITKFDLVNKIVSGRFNAILKQTACPDLNITEGRFDLTFDVYD